MLYIRSVATVFQLSLTIYVLSTQWSIVNCSKSVYMKIAHYTLDLTSRMTKIKDHALFWAFFEGSRCLLIMHGSQEQAPAYKTVITILVKLKRCVKIKIRLDYICLLCVSFGEFLLRLTVLLTIKRILSIVTNNFQKDILGIGIFLGIYKTD